jgi:hypothetical protein
VPASAANRFVISTGAPGTVWFSLVSLFPPTYKNRSNGNRQDIMQLLAGLKPSFLRFPGGNCVEGPNYENRWNWKATISYMAGLANRASGLRSPGSLQSVFMRGSYMADPAYFNYPPQNSADGIWAESPGQV